MTHEECVVSIALHWAKAVRGVPDGAQLHPTVYKRLAMADRFSWYSGQPNLEPAFRDAGDPHALSWETLYRNHRARWRLDVGRRFERLPIGQGICNHEIRGNRSGDPCDRQNGQSWSATCDPMQPAAAGPHRPLFFPKGSFDAAQLFHFSPRREGFSRKICDLGNVKR